MKTSAFLRAVFFMLIGFVLLASPSQSSAADRKTRIFSVKDPKSGDTINVEAPVSTRAEFNKDKPSALFAERDKMRQEMIKNCAANKVGIFRSVKKQFVPESVGFAAAIAVVGQLEANGDPGAIKHWYEQSVTDPLAHLSFGMFMVGNRAAGQFFNMVGWTFDPCSAVKKVKPGAPLVFAETRTQKLFRPIAGGMSMSAGFILSSVTHEFLADQNLRMCANIMLGRIPQEKMKEAERACDIAHEDWAPGNKMSEYLDDVLANITFVCLQGYGVAAAKQLLLKGAGGAEGLAAKKMIAGYALKRTGQKLGAAGGGLVMKFGVTQGAKTIVFNGAVAALTVGKFVGGPAVRAAIWIGNMVIFLKGIELIMPIFEKPWVQFTDGREVTAAISEIMAELNRAEKNGWVWTAPAKPLRCTIPPRGSATLYYEGDDYIPPECFKDPKTPAQLVDRLNHKQKKWREFVLRDAFMETSNWQDFVLQFTNTYSASYKLYSYVVSQIANQRFLVDKKVEGARPDYLYWRPEHWGLPIDYSKWDGKICNLPKETKDLMAEGRALIDKEIATSKWSPKTLLMPDTFLGLPNVNPNFGWKDWRVFNSPIHTKESDVFAKRLKTIRDGLVAMDCRVPMPVTPEYKSIREVSPQQLEQLRLRRFNKAISMLFAVVTREPLSGYARWTDAGRGIDHPMYPWFAKVNPFMRLNMILGDPEPYPDGVAFIRMINDEPTYIDQDRKEDHPRKVGDVATPKMSEYILANMVCGPDANRRDQISSISLVDRGRDAIRRGGSFAKRSFLDSGYRMFGYKYVPKQRDEHMIEIVEGWKSRFVPPRIIEDPGYDICRTTPARGDWKMDAGEMPTNDYQWDPHMNYWDVRGKRYMGLVNVVKGNIRRDVLGDNMNDGTFQKWWATKVEPHAKQIVAKFKVQYRQIIAHKYLPALLKNERVTYNNRSFALGARNSMLDEMKLNLAILQKLQNAGRAPKESGYDGVKNNTSFILKLFERGLKFVGTQSELKTALLEEAKGPIKIQGAPYYTDAKQPVTYASPVAVAAYARNAEFLKNAIETLDKVMSNTSKKLTPAATKTVNGVREAAIVNLKNLVTELDSYNGMLLSLRLEDIPQAAN